MVSSVRGTNREASKCPDTFNSAIVANRTKLQVSSRPIGVLTTNDHLHQIQLHV